MKKYYNEKNEQFKMEKGTISEIKNYLGKTDIYMYQDGDNGKWHMSFAKGWIDHEGHMDWGIWIPLSYMVKITTESIAHICGYYEE